MIKRVSLNNIFGIKKFEIDFSLKNLQEEGTIENQLLLDDKDKVALLPMFLAKNAAGKTSFIKAINFVLRFTKKETFLKELRYHKMKYFQKIIWKSNIKQKDTNEIFLEFSKDKTIEYLFNELAFVGSSKVIVDITLTKKRSIQMELTKDGFFIILNNQGIKQIIDIALILDSIIVKDITNKTPIQVFQEIDKILKKITKDMKFENFDINVASLFRDTSILSEMNEFNIKNNTSKHIRTMVHKFGFEPTRLLIKKLDPNIHNINFDPKDQTIDIYLKTFNKNFSITPKLLSFGTQKVLEIIYKSLNLFSEGGIMLIDEIENGLHLSLIKLIISLYTDEDINKKSAQLIITTHNPLIAEREIIEPKNVFMFEKNNFINIKKNTSRTSDIISFVKNKNYHSDIFWYHKGVDSKTTLSPIAINQIINTISESKEWQKR